MLYTSVPVDHLHENEVALTDTGVFSTLSSSTPANPVANQISSIEQSDSGLLGTAAIAQTGTKRSPEKLAEIRMKSIRSYRLKVGCRSLGFVSLYIHPSYHLTPFYIVRSSGNLDRWLPSRTARLLLRHTHAGLYKI